MNCTEFREALEPFLRKTLDEASARAFEEHRDSCATCGELFAGLCELTCRELAEFLDDYLSNRLADERREVFERHLALCPCCESYLDSYRKTVELGRDACSAGEGSETPRMPEELIRAIMNAMSREP